MRVTPAILMGFGLMMVTAACGDSSSQPSAVDRSTATVEPTRSSTATMPSATAAPATAPTPTTEAPGESTPVASEPPLDPRFYQPPVLTAGGAIAAEIRSTATPSEDPSIVEFRLVEFADGPFIETTVVHLAAGSEASLWSLYIDDRLRSKFSYPTGRHGTRITPEQYNNGVTVRLDGTDAAGDVIAATETVEIPPS